MTAHFVCFADDAIPQPAVSRSRHGLPVGDLLGDVDVRQHLRSECVEWFEGWWDPGGLAAIASLDLGESFERLTDARVCYTIKLVTDDRPDLSPLQTAWALVRSFVDAGANVVLDAQALWYRDADAVRACSFDAFDIRREIKITRETDATEGELHLVHSRGMGKFARPDLLAWTTPDDQEVVAASMSTIGRALAEGTPSLRVSCRIMPGIDVVLQPFTDRLLLDQLGVAEAARLVRSDGAPISPLIGSDVL
jgi:hypothetical protein